MTKNAINFSHPSVVKLKNIRPVVAYSISGLIMLDKDVYIPIKSRQSANSAISSQDVSINGIYTLRRERDGSYPINRNLISSKIPSGTNLSLLSNSNPSILPTPPEKLPDILQQSGICQIVPFLHMIQSQLDWNMDYESLWKCLPTDLSTDPVINLSDIIMWNSSYKKYWNLLFSNKCFVVNEIPKKCPAPETQYVGNEKTEADCNNPCSRRIKIKTVQLPRIKSEKDLCDRLTNFGPVPMGSFGTTTAKLTLLAYGEHTWDDIKNMTFNQVKNLINQFNPAVANSLGFGFGLGHAVTIISCTNGVFTVKNSWHGDTEFNLSWEDIKKHFSINPTPPRESGTIFPAAFNYYPFVEECDSDADSLACREEKCKLAGYDGFVNSPDPNDCDCYCEEIEVPSSQPGAECLNAGQKVQKVIGFEYDDKFGWVKKCVCPEHSQPELFYYGKDCCETATEDDSDSDSEPYSQSLFFKILP